MAEVAASQDTRTVLQPAAVDSRAKRAIDATLGLAFLLLASPILLAAGVAVALESGWPVLYSQERVGLCGRRFRMVKFRTMIHDAHALRPQIVHMNEAPFPAFKVRRDPRVTAVGRLLRRSSIDELPQLWNVVRGQMSLVGPRPALPEEVTHYDPTALLRLGVRPGITGLWQLENRAGRLAGFDEWVACDLKYVKTWSLVQDFVIMARTVREVLSLSGH